MPVREASMSPPHCFIIIHRRLPPEYHVQASPGTARFGVGWRGEVSGTCARGNLGGKGKQMSLSLPTLPPPPQLPLREQSTSKNSSRSPAGEIFGRPGYGATVRPAESRRGADVLDPSTTICFPHVRDALGRPPPISGQPLLPNPAKSLTPSVCSSNRAIQSRFARSRQEHGGRQWLRSRGNGRCCQPFLLV